MNIMPLSFDEIVYIDAYWPFGGVYFDFLAVSKASFSMVSDWSSLS